MSESEPGAIRKPETSHRSTPQLSQPAETIDAVSSQQKSAEENSRISEEKFRSVFEAANVGKSITSLAGEISVNKAFAEMLGYTREELANITWQQLTPAEEIDAIQSNLAPLLQGEKDSASFIKRYIHKNGSHIWADVHVAVQRDLNGEPMYFITTVVDITARRNSELALQRSNDLLQLLVEHTPAAIAMFDNDMKYLAASRRFFEDYHIKDHSIIGRSHYEVFPEIPERWKEIHRRCLAGAVERCEEDPFPRSDGTTDWVRWEILPWYEHSGKIGGIILFSEVITERKRAEEALSESEELYRNLLESAPIGIAVHSGGKVVFSNLAGARILGGESEDQIIGRSIVDIIHPDGMKTAQARIQRMLAGEQGLYPVEDTYLRLDGTSVPVEVMANALHYDGKPAVQVIVTDISERKKAEAELRLSRDRLEEMSRRLLQAHETEQRALARELHDQIGQILTALRLTLDIIPHLPPAQSEAKLSEAQEYVSDLLARISRISLELRPPMLDDLGLIPALLWLANRYQAQTEIEIEFKHLGLEGERFTPDLETAAYRVIQEALTHVARHSHARHVQLRLQKRNRMLFINIEDDGSGFDLRTVLAQKQSSGIIGMRERTELLNGDFHIESRPGEGTQIFISLPL